MSTKKQRKLDRKRKAKQARDRRAKRPESLAYSGNKYKTDELVPLVFTTESAVYEAFVISGRRITDRDVVSALETLIRAIRHGQVQPTESVGDDGHLTASDNLELITTNVRVHWSRLFQDAAPYPGRDNVVGVLRTILGSVDCWTTARPTSRGYLKYIEGFLNEAGVSVQAIPADEVEDELGIEPEDEFAEPAPEDAPARKPRRFWLW